MKYTTAAHILLVASIATSTIAVPRPGPASKSVPHQQRRKNSSASSSSSPGLLVDREGNLYSPRTKSNVQKDSSLPTAVCLRGGGLCVDNEGNFYTKSPQAKTKEEPTQKKTASRAPSAPSDTTSTLRGGSHNHNLGGLGVDSDGNLFATQALLLRGGDLSVDREGNFYTPRVEVVKPPLATSRRRLSSSSQQHDAVLLTKNHRVSKKTISAGSKSKKPAGQDPMAFIGYNNALMET